MYFQSETFRMQLGFQTFVHSNPIWDCKCTLFICGYIEWEQCGRNQRRAVSGQPGSPVRGLSPLRGDLPHRSLDGGGEGGGDLCWNHNTEPYTKANTSTNWTDCILPADPISMVSSLKIVTVFGDSVNIITHTYIFKWDYNKSREGKMQLHFNCFCKFLCSGFWCF